LSTGCWRFLLLFDLLESFFAASLLSLLRRREVVSLSLLALYSSSSYAFILV
jgi:hypothetical protein